MLEFALQHKIITMIIAIVIIWTFYDLNAIWANTLKAKYISQSNSKKIKVISKVRIREKYPNHFS